MGNFNVSNFIGAMKKDGARPNLFLVELPGTNTSQTFENPIPKPNENIIFKAHATQIPGVSVGMVGAYYFGRLIKFPGTQSFQNWTATIIMDEDDYQITNARGYFEAWLEQLNKKEENTRGNSFSTPSLNERTAGSYMRNGKITHYGKDGKDIATYKLLGCFPTGMSPIELSWGANEAISQFSVEFAVQYWTRDDGNPVTVPGSKGPNVLTT